MSDPGYGQLLEFVRIMAKPLKNDYCECLDCRAATLLPVWRRCRRCAAIFVLKSIGKYEVIER